MYRIKNIIVIVLVIIAIGFTIWYVFPATTFIENGLPNGSQWVLSYGTLGSSITSWPDVYSTTGQITVYVFRFDSYLYSASAVHCVANISGMPIFNGGTPTIALHFIC